MENFALLLHLLGAFLLVAGMTVAGVAFEAARRRQSPNDVALLLGMTRVGVLLVALGTLLAAGFGLWLVDLGNVGYGTGWVGASAGLLLATIAVGSLGGRRPKQARKLAVAERDQVRVSPELRALLEDRLARVLNYLALILIVAIVVLMVTRPT
jgi:uncharacterized membrane protein